jgi:hypothetical protein
MQMWPFVHGFMGGTMYCMQTGHSISFNRASSRARGKPSISITCHMFRHVVTRIWTSSIVITKCSSSVTSGHMVCCGFQGHRPEAVTSPVLFSHKSRALSSRYLSHCCSNIFYFIYCINIRSNITHNDSFYPTIT